MRREADVKKAVKKILSKYGENVWWYMPVQTGYGVHGVPDFIVCFRGVFVGIETKFGYNKPTANQERQMNSIATAGGQVFVVNENNLNELEAALEELSRERDCR